MLVSEVLKRTVNFFKNKGIETARIDSEILLSKALGWQRIELYTKFEYPMTEEEMNRCRDLVKRRSEGEPVAYITGEVGFYKDDFSVGPGVLIPRPDSETILDELEALTKPDSVESILKNQSQLVVMDLGAGSGCIGLSVLRLFDQAQLIGIESSEKAFNYCIANQESLGLTDRSTFINCRVEDFAWDQTQIDPQMADIIVANPPYIAEGDSDLEAMVEKYEPSEALFSADNGLEHIKSWLNKSAEWLVSGGVLLFEIGHKQGIVCKDLLENSGHFRDCKVIKDLSGNDRVVRAIKK